MVLLSDARKRGVDGAVKQNLANARSQAEVFYNTNTTSPNSYTGVCTTPGPVGGAKTVAAQVSGAAKAATGSTTYTTNGTGAVGSATCNDNSASGVTWAAEVPLVGSGANQMWCVDSTGKSRQENNVSIGAGTTCP